MHQILGLFEKFAHSQANDRHASVRLDSLNVVESL